MKTNLFLALILAAGAALADNYTQGYMRSDGTYVQPHHQTAPDRNPYNNYSTQGNVNPYTGQQGYRDPAQVQQQYAPQNNYYGNPYPNPQPRTRNGW